MSKSSIVSRSQGCQKTSKNGQKMVKNRQKTSKIDKKGVLGPFLAQNWIRGPENVSKPHPPSGTQNLRLVLGLKMRKSDF
jgi:hypothetical protein